MPERDSQPGRAEHLGRLDVGQEATIALEEIAGSAKEGLLALAVGAGLHFVAITALRTVRDWLTDVENAIATMISKRPVPIRPTMVISRISVGNAMIASTSRWTSMS